MEKPLKVTFDKNVCEFVVGPLKAPNNRAMGHLKIIQKTLCDGNILLPTNGQYKLVFFTGT
jgi:hypothetical protein